MRRDRELERLTGRLAPELRDRVAVLVEVPQGLAAPDSGGFAVRRCPPQIAAMEPTIGDLQLVAIVGEQSGEGQLGILLHEIAHLVPHEIAVPRMPIFAERDFQLFQSGHYERPDAPPWSGDHSARFLRACCHLWFRSASIGEYVPPHRIVFSLNYQLSSLAYYLQALCDEPVRCRHWEFAEIEALPPPKAFNELFMADVQTFETKEKNHADAN